MAWEDLRQLTRSKRLHLVAVAEVDLKRTVQLRRLFPRALIYQDWRELLAGKARISTR